MTISALVLTLDQKNFQAAIDALRADPRLALGEQHGNRLPVVAETHDCRAGRDLYDELRDVSGVEFVDVVMVDFSEEEAA
jgi:hypothetical protein